MSHIWTSEVTSHGGEKHLQSVCSLTWLVIKQTYLRSLLLFCKKYPHNIFIRYCIFSVFVRSLVLSCPNVSLCGYVELKMTMKSLKHWNELLGRLQNPESSSITVVDSHVSRFVVMTADSVRWWPLGAVEKLGPDLELDLFFHSQLVLSVSSCERLLETCCHFTVGMNASFNTTLQRKSSYSILFWVDLILSPLQNKQATCLKTCSE